MPDLSTTESHVKLLHWLVNVGDLIQRGQSIVEVETDKATVEVESVVSGTLVETTARSDQQVEVGSVIGIVEVAG
jgi:pyruvate/2-oxoglutarate dehydrogenase complex dihydrolipoamide acyltransferase (E2) component